MSVSMRMIPECERKGEGNPKKGTYLRYAMRHTQRDTLLEEQCDGKCGEEKHSGRYAELWKRQVADE